LVIIGIVQGSTLIRIIVLLFAWATVVLGGLEIAASLKRHGIQLLPQFLPVAAAVVTIWGLWAKESVDYFNAQKRQKKANKSASVKKSRIT
jgi:hypothetical protein